MKTRPKQDSDLIQRHALLTKLQNLLRHETGLGIFTGRLDQRGQGTIQLSREEVLGIFLGRSLNDFIGEIQDRLSAPVVLLQLVDPAARKQRREFHDVPKRRSPEGVN